MAPQNTSLMSKIVVHLLLVASLLGPQVLAQNSPGFVPYQNSDGQTVLLQDDREPALYTGSFGDCLGGSLLDITRFDAEYWADNMTVGFHLAGTSTVSNLTVVMFLSVFAYGSSRFNLLFNPCGTAISGLCPTNTSLPIEAAGIIPVSAQNIAGIPPIAFSIPDFEGQAILRVFSNATESEIACFSASVTNGNTLSHPQIIASTVGIFVLAAVVASFASAIYGTSIPIIRTHYAHSMSVWVVFACLHHVFFTGALSVNWPAVLPAFWSNFAPFAGMIYSDKIMSSVNSFLGFDVGNTSFVGASPQGSQSNGVGGGYVISDIYRRGKEIVYGRAPGSLSEIRQHLRASHLAGRDLQRRALPDQSSGFMWYGSPVEPGLPLPGNSSGLSGALGVEGIPVSQAFLTGVIWFSVLLGGVVLLVVLFKVLLEAGSSFGVVRRNTLSLFRRYWIAVAAMVAARTFYIAFFMIVYLCLFQFVYQGPVGVTAVAGVVCAVFLIGSGGIAFLACYYRLRFGTLSTRPDKLHLESKGLWVGVSRQSTRDNLSSRLIPVSKSLGTLPFFRIEFDSKDSRQVNVHEDEEFLKRYGWLSARFKRNRWWFFAAWLGYETMRAAFFGIAAGHPQTQVFGLLSVEIIAFIVIWLMKPFEGNRLNVITIYLLGFSKVSTVALSSAFDPHFNIDRITAAAIGLVIVVIQGLLIVAMLILIILGAMSTRMSLTRNRELGQGSEDWAKLRERYFKHIELAAHDGNDIEPQPAPLTPVKGPASKEFRVSSIRRMPKIEDADDPEAADFDPYGSRISVIEGNGPIGFSTRRTSRANSVQSNLSYSALPFGARPHRRSWSSRDFQTFMESQRPSRVNSVIMGPTSDRGSLHAMQSEDSIRTEPPRPVSYSRPIRRSSGWMENAAVPVLSAAPPDFRRSRGSRRSTFNGASRVGNIHESVNEEGPTQEDTSPRGSSPETPEEDAHNDVVRQAGSTTEATHESQTSPRGAPSEAAEAKPTPEKDLADSSVEEAGKEQGTKVNTDSGIIEDHDI